MEDEKLESLLIDYIDGKLNDEDKQRVEAALHSNVNTRKLYNQLKQVISLTKGYKSLQPSSKLKVAFYEMLQEETRIAKNKHRISITPLFYKAVAAVAFIILAGAAGFWFSAYKHQQNEIAAIKKEMQRTRSQMMTMLKNHESPGQRILGVKAAYGTANVDDEIVHVLIKTLNEDPNSNVRLAALDVLKKFKKEPAVRRALIQSLSSQMDPIIQISLIHFMVELNEMEAIKSFERIINDEAVLPEVKDEAYAGILKLS